MRLHACYFWGQTLERVKVQIHAFKGSSGLNENITKMPAVGSKIIRESSALRGKPSPGATLLAG